ncbi:MAG: TIGR04133 family radical SAM/SPASM protein [Bacteroidales bacterium]|nr:TIGR04133 family radical SAM/SPASM protein [Bacteroidales bacterium]
MNLKEEIWRQYRHNQAQLHPLRTLFWECTLRCNMHCRHCGSDCKVSTTTPDMPAADFFKAIDDITPHVNPNEVFVIFTGGEALLRPDIEDCGLELYRRGFPWGIVSNGYLLDQRRLDSLLDSGMHSIAISLDGLEEEHNWMRQTPDSYARASRAISLLAKEDGLLWDVVTCVNPRNYAQLDQIKERLIDLGCRRWRLFAIFPMGRAAKDPELQLSREQFTGLLDFARRTREEGRIVCNYACEGYLGPYERKVRDQYYFCRAGIEVASILCDGSISGCTSIRSNLHQGNIYHDSLWEVWNNRFQPYRDRSWARKGQCASCKQWRYCEGNGLHLYDDDRNLLSCSLRRIAR